jgi:hypothetical protein
MIATTMRFHRKPLSVVCIMGGLILLGGCATRTADPVLRTSDTEINRLAQQAKALFEMQRPSQAVPLYQAALDRSRALNDDLLIARLAYNLGACRLESGDARGAGRAFEEAIHAARTAGLSDAESQLFLGYALLEQGETDRVLSLCNEVMESQTHSDMRMRIQLLRAEAYLKNNLTDRAAETLLKVGKQLTPTSSLTIQAQAAYVEGAILSRQEAPSKSADAFLREARLWSMANRPAKTVRALDRAAEEQQRAKDRSAEADSRYRAARALLGLERFVEASAQLALLEAIPEDDWLPTLKPLVPHLRQELEKRSSPR